jgi:hypothetical protein
MEERRRCRKVKEFEGRGGEEASDERGEEEEKEEKVEIKEEEKV